MREISYTSRFKRDYKREKSGRHGKTLDTILIDVVNLLVADAPLLRRTIDHPLTGEWADHRDCHIKPRPPPTYLPVTAKTISGIGIISFRCPNVT